VSRSAGLERGSFYPEYVLKSSRHPAHYEDVQSIFMGLTIKVLIWISLMVAAAARIRADEPLLQPADERFLKEQAARIVESARLAPGQVSGKWRNTTPYTIHIPGGNMGYPAYWVRDSVMMLGGSFVKASEIEEWVRLICKTLPDRDWNVRPGVVVPAFAVPDHINFDGKPTFYPGNYETGTRQGGPP
jgi:hypothetical protein